MSRILTDGLATKGFFLTLCENKIFPDASLAPRRLLLVVESSIEALKEELRAHEERERRGRIRSSLGGGKGDQGGARRQGPRRRLRRRPASVGGGRASLALPRSSRRRSVQLSEAEEAQVAMLVAMGFERPRAVRAFVECGRNQEHAANYLLSGAI